MKNWTIFLCWYVPSVRNQCHVLSLFSTFPLFIADHIGIKVHRKCRNCWEQQKEEFRTSDGSYAIQNIFSSRGKKWKIDTSKNRKNHKKVIICLFLAYFYCLKNKFLFFSNFIFYFLIFHSLNTKYFVIKNVPSWLFHLAAIFIFHSKFYLFSRKIVVVCGDLILFLSYIIILGGKYCILCR